MPEVATIRAANRQTRNAALREEFARLWTNAPRPRPQSKEFILAKLAEKYFLSLSTIEDIVYTKPAAVRPTPTAKAPPPSAGPVQAVASPNPPMAQEQRWRCQVCGQEMGYSQPINLKLALSLMGAFIKYHQRKCGKEVTNAG